MVSEVDKFAAKKIKLDPFVLILSRSDSRLCHRPSQMTMHFDRKIC